MKWQHLEDVSAISRRELISNGNRPSLSGNGKFSNRCSVSALTPLTDLEERAALTVFYFARFLLDLDR